LRPWLSLVLADAPVNKETETLVNVMEKAAGFCDLCSSPELSCR
jgi:hypothetical protein